MIKSEARNSIKEPCTALLNYNTLDKFVYYNMRKLKGSELLLMVEFITS
jgi:hypothetical protein